MVSIISCFDNFSPDSVKIVAVITLGEEVALHSALVGLNLRFDGKNIIVQVLRRYFSISYLDVTCIRNKSHIQFQVATKDAKMQKMMCRTNFQGFFLVVPQTLLVVRTVNLIPPYPPPNETYQNIK